MQTFRNFWKIYSATFGKKWGYYLSEGWKLWELERMLILKFDTFYGLPKGCLSIR